MGEISTQNLVLVALTLAIAAGIPGLFPKLPVPGVVFEIVIGAIIGPQVLGWVHPAVILNFLANFGFAVLMLMAGFEMNPAVLKGRPMRNAMLGWMLTVVIAFSATILLTSQGLAQSWLLTGLALSTTAIAALLPILRDCRALSAPYGPMVLAAGAMGEAGPVIVLSLVLAKGAAPREALVMICFAAAATGAVVLAARGSGGYIAQLVGRTMASSGQLPARVAICLVILLVVLSEQLQIEAVLGAFAAGALMRAGIQSQHHEAFSARLDGLGSAFLVPIFFIASGIRLDVGPLFSDPATLAMVPVYALLMLVARGLPALLLYRADLPFRSRIALALHSGTQISMVVAITGIAVQHGLMPGSQGAALVGAGIITVILFPALSKRFLKGDATTNGKDSLARHAPETA